MLADPFVIALEAIALLATSAASYAGARRRIDMLSGRWASLALVVATVLVPALFFMDSDPDIDPGVLRDVRILHLLGVTLFCFAYQLSLRISSHWTFAPLTFRRNRGRAFAAYIGTLVLYAAIFTALAASPLLLSLKGDFAGAIQARLAITHGYSDDAFPFVFRFWGLVYYYLLAPALFVAATHLLKRHRPVPAWALLGLLFLVLSASLEKANLLKFVLCCVFAYVFARGATAGTRLVAIAVAVVGLIAVLLQYSLVNFGETNIFESAYAAFERLSVGQTKSSQYAYMLLRDGLPRGFSFIDFSALDTLLGIDPEVFRRFKLEVFMLTTKHTGDDVVGSAGGYGFIHWYLQFGVAASLLYFVATVLFFLFDDYLRLRSQAAEARAFYFWWVMCFFFVPVTGYEYFFSPLLLSITVWALLLTQRLFFCRGPLRRRRPAAAVASSEVRSCA